MKIFEFGQIIPDLQIDGKDAPYPVIDERVARASAGVLFVGAGIAFAQAFLVNNRTYLSYFILLFFVEFAIRVLVNPRLAPIYVIGKLLTRNQKPEWVGAVQKRFAWSLGLGMAITMIVLTWVAAYTGIWTRILCLVCLTLLWLETSCGICVGCKIYYGLIHMGILRQPDIAPACPGGVCAIRKKS
ncbi:MAG TPA: DUF4395 domain-containing protein [Acidobacteriota bacterium]|nr:DUF4395 domain-containing protein [Acidobacteriota bacterium]